MMKMMGLSTTSYWIINYCFFTLIYWIYCFCFVLVCAPSWGGTQITVFSAHDQSLVFVCLVLFVNQA